MTTGQILPASPIEPVLSLRNLRVSYGEREILHCISFDVLRGETLVILGGSGSGKSTLLRTLVGLEKPSAGEIWIKGRDLAKTSAAEMDEIRRKIGMSFQGGALFGSMTVGENVALPLREHTRLEDSTIEIILRLKLQQVGLEGFEYYTPAQLSGGMKKRAAVARALAMDPEILFFDEPSAGLDPIIAAGIDELILELKRAFHMTIIVVTHELASAFLIADRMLLIDKGNIVALGTTEDVRYAGGPKVGRVDSVQLDPQNPARLDIVFSVQSDLPVKVDSSVKIMSMSPLGDNHLEIYPGSAQAPRAASGAALPSLKYVDFNALTAQLNDLNPQAQELLRNLNDLASEWKETIPPANIFLGPQNRANLAATIANARGMLEDNRPKIKTTLQNVNAVSEKLQPLLEDFRKTSEQANQTLNHVDAMVGENRADVRQAAVELRPPRTNMTDASARLDQTLDVNSENIDELLDNMRHVTANLKQFTATLKTRPYTLIRASNPREHKTGEQQ